MINIFFFFQNNFFFLKTMFFFFFFFFFFFTFVNKADSTLEIGYAITISSEESSYFLGFSEGTPLF
jgi:hypothetical protein